MVNHRGSSHANKQMYNIGIRLLDKMYRIVNKLNDCSDDQSVKQLVSSIMILTNYLPRYEWVNWKCSEILPESFQYAKKLR